jgi:hypothetical protein
MEPIARPDAYQCRQMSRTQQRRKKMKLKTARVGAVIGIAVFAAGTATAAAATSAKTPHDRASFALERSTASVAAGCLPYAGAHVKIKNKGPVEIMTVDAFGLPKNTDFDLFVNQLPNAPFGISWYQGDLETNGQGKAHGEFVGRFNVETFTVAPGSGPAPVVHNDGPIKDAATNPAFAPVHEYHIGVWFNSSKDAVAAGCANVTTPFNGDHNAGPQALSTRQFADTNGPLRQITP